MSNYLDKLHKFGIVKLDKMTGDDLSWLREIVNLNYKNRLLLCYPKMEESILNNNINLYHEIRNLVDHEMLWKKKYRLFNNIQIEELVKRNFYTNLVDIFGDFKISDQTYDGELFEGQEEVYWRLVSPGIENDVGGLHADSWFHEAHKLNFYNNSSVYKTLKVWIPVYCENSKNGLMGVSGSHTRNHKFYFEKRNNINYPVYSGIVSALELELIDTNPGEILVFDDNYLHMGSLNNGYETRVSIEITLKFQNCT